MQGAGQIIGIGDGRFVARCRQILFDGLKVRFGFVLEDVEKYRVNFFFRNGLLKIVDVVNVVEHFGGRSLLTYLGCFCSGHGCGARKLPVGQCVGSGFQSGGFYRGRFTVLKIADQGGNGVGDILQQLSDVVIHEHAAVDDTVQQVLDRPGQFANNGSADHSSTALEGMECAANFCQSTAIIVLAQQHGQIFANGVEHFASFFNEYLKDLIVERSSSAASLASVLAVVSAISGW